MGYPVGTSVITARKRSLRRLCFHRCLSVHKGGCAWLLLGGGGMHGCSRGHLGVACVVALGGMHGCSGGCAWLLWGVCVVAQGHAWLLWGACVVARGCAWFFRGVHGFSGGPCMVISGGGMHRIRQDTVNERAVRILLECILVSDYFLL